MHKKSDEKHLSRSPVARPAPESLPGLKMLLLLLFVVLPVVPVVVLLVSHLDRIIIIITYIIDQAAPTGPEVPRR